MSDHVKGRKLTSEVQNRTSKLVTKEGYNHSFNPCGLTVVPMRVNAKNGLNVLRLHYSLHPKVDDAWLQKERGAMSRSRWDRDMELQYNALGGRLIFEEYRDDTHLVDAFPIPEHWWKLRVIDYGRRNPTCCLWITMDYEGNSFVYREWYHPSFTQMQMSDAAHVTRYTLPQHAFFIKTFSRELVGESPEKYIITLIDPQGGEETFGNSVDSKTVIDHLALEGVSCSKASKASNGLDVIENMLREERLYFFRDETPNTQLEIKNYRWANFTEATQTERNKKESPVKKNDHAMNCLKFYGNYPVKRSVIRATREIEKWVRQDMTDVERAVKDIAQAKKRVHAFEKRKSRLRGFA